MKLSMEALKERADAVASTELLNSISGGTENSCHCGYTMDGGKSFAGAIFDWIHAGMCDVHNILP